MRAPMTTALCLAVAAPLLLATTAGTAQAAEAAPPLKEYVQRCTDLGNGDLCIDVTGKVGQVGVIGVGYWKRKGDPVWVKLGWQNNTGGGANWASGPPQEIFSGGNTGTKKWSTYLAAGCVYPLIGVIAGGGMDTLKGKEVCVPS
ncbi:hypothetical protein [Streptomyces rimosus]|uniref:hypothetical protein n=1 Tax=Streptomyces rimosus TaxID=1927 RepID=UPI0004C48ED0|nr:hypothetical protein [Streptomyces rimosus]